MSATGGSTSKDQLPEWAKPAIDALQDYGYNPAAKSVLIKIDRQRLYLLQNKKVISDYPISTSRFGIGNREHSHQTPTGTHCVAEMVGAGCRSGEIIKARVPIGVKADISYKPVKTGEDVITSRVIRLRGLEEGVNAGDGVDSFERYIYIHGTVEEGLIGQPASIGCIRMKNRQVIELYDRLNVGMYVQIVA